MLIALAQHLFEEDPSVFYASLHQYPHYPGTGAAAERGRGAGEGATLNCPLPAGSTDADYLRAFESRVLPGLEAFARDFGKHRGRGRVDFAADDNASIAPKYYVFFHDQSGGNPRLQQKVIRRFTMATIYEVS